MKKIILSTTLAASLCSADMESFLDDAISSTTEDTGYYQSQTRGLYTLGAGKFRFNHMGSYSPFNVEVPKFSMGCGGLDMVFGGFSYLNPEYLVEKLKAIASAAPAFAFQIALANLCEDCVTRMNELESIANAINNFSMDTCKASQRLGTFAADQAMNYINGNMSSGQNNNFISAQEDAKSNQNKTWTDYIKTVSYYMGSDDLAKDAVETIALQGSLVKEAIENTSGINANLLGNDNNGGPLLTSLLRVMIGDIIGYRAKLSGASTEAGTPDGTHKLMFSFPYTVNLDSFINGGKLSYINVQTQTDNYGKPTVTEGSMTFSGIMPIFQTRIDSIISKIKTKTEVDADDRKFINSLPIPIAKFLNTAVLTNSKTDDLAEFLAILETKAFLSFVVQTAAKVLNYKNIKNTPDYDIDTKKFVQDIANNASKYHTDLTIWFDSAMKDWSQKKQMTDYYRELEQRLKSKLAGSNTFNSIGI